MTQVSIQSVPQAGITDPLKKEGIVPHQLPGAGIDPKKIGYFAALFYYLMEAMQTRQQSVMNQSGEIQLNAKLQNALNDQNAAVKFTVLPAKATQATINRVQTENQQFAAIRENIQNTLITARQNAQVLMTQTSTNVNLLQQNASEDSGWLQTLNTIFQVIDEMTQR